MEGFPLDQQVWWIKWKDAVGLQTRFDGDSIAAISLVINTNLGFVAHENEERVVLVAGISTSGEVDALVIPTHDIVERIPVGGKAEKSAKPKKGR